MITAPGRLTALLALLLCAVLLFCACSSKNAAKELQATDFKCTVDAEFKDMAIKGTLTRYTAGSLVLEIDEPASIKGLKMEWNGESVSMSLHGLSFDVNADTFPQSAIGNIIGDALDSAQSTQLESKNTSEGLVTYGQAAAGNYEIVSDPDTGYILGIRVPSQELNAKFSDMVITKETQVMADADYEYVID